MRKIYCVFIIIFIFFTIFNINSKDNINNNDLIKRKIAIIPFKNSLNITEYDYIGESVSNKMKIDLEEYFTLIDFNIINKALEDFKYNGDEITVKEADKLGLLLNCDVVVFGDFSVRNEELNFNINTYDLVTQQLIIDKKIKCIIGFDIFEFLSKLSQEYSGSLKEKLFSYDKNIINVLKNKDKAPQDRKQLLDEFFLNQDNKYWYIFINDGKHRINTKIPFGKNIIIFVSSEIKFIIEYEGEKDELESRIKIMSFNNEPNKKREFKINTGNNKSFIYKYTQKEDFEVVLKNVNDLDINKEIKNHSFFLESSAIFTTSGYMGTSLGIGLGLPINSKLENNIYIRTFFLPKVLNFIETEKGVMLDTPHLKFNLGIGYEHVFYIKNFVGIYLGLGFGFELYFFSFLINNKQKIYSSLIIPGCPSFYFSIPIGVQLFANRKFSLIIGVEPTLRFVINYFFYEGLLWIENLDESRGSELTFLRKNLNDSLTLDLFLYDMPVSISLRIKF